MKTLNRYFEQVKEKTATAKLVAFDGCHKIYIAMTDVDAKWFEDRDDYTINKSTPSEMYETVIGWYVGSCSLRFVSAITDDKFETVIPQK